MAYLIPYTRTEEFLSALSEEATKIRQAQLAGVHRLIASQEDVAGAVRQVAVHLREGVHGVDTLSSLFDWRLADLAWAMEQQREVLKEILEVLQAPLDTQAKELRKRAIEAYDNGWTDEALKDFSESATKDPYDFSVHHYLGNIYLFRKTEPDKALVHYESAAKYATPKSPYYASLALLHLARAHYLKGDFRGAHGATSRAVALSPELAEGHYEHARYSARLGKCEEAIEHLDTAQGYDRYYLAKAVGDHDFDGMAKELGAFCKRKAGEAKGWAMEEARAAAQAIRTAGEYSAAQYAPEQFGNARREFARAKSIFQRNSYLGYCEAAGAFKEAHQMGIRAGVEALKKRIHETELSQQERNKVTEKAFLIPFWIVFGLSVLGMVVAIAGGAIDAAPTGDVVGDIIGGLVCGLIGGVIIGGLCGLINGAFLGGIVYSIVYVAKKSLFLFAYRGFYDEELAVLRDQLAQLKE